MPYIKREDRKEMVTPQNPGELAYELTALCIQYLRDRGLKYSTLATLDGVLGLTQHEIRRRIVGYYEDQKCRANGDVGFEEWFGLEERN